MGRTLRLFLVIAFCSVYVSGIGYAIYPDDSDTGKTIYSRGSLIIKFDPNSSPEFGKSKYGIVTTGNSGIDQLNRKYEVTRQEQWLNREKRTVNPGPLQNVFIFHVDNDVNIREMQAEYEKLDVVAYAEPDYLYELYDIPNDPLYSRQWALNNTGQEYFHVQVIPGDNNDKLVMAHGFPDADIDAEEVFANPPENTYSVIVALIDTGVDIDHPELNGKIWIKPGEIPFNGIDDDNNGYIDDINGWDFSSNDYFPIDEDDDPTDYLGHGTHCAGIIAGLKNNGEGIAGIADDVRIMPLKVFPMAYTSVLARAVLYAADNGADVINMSLGGAYPSHLLLEAIEYARSRGLIICAAAGNGASDSPNYPAAYSGTIAVGASSSEDRVTDYSSFGDHINVIAPGNSILSLRADSTDMYAERGEPGVHIIDSIYYVANGTSMACPHAAGVIAYMLEVSPGLSADRALEILESTSEDIIDPYGMGGNYPGWDRYSGSGRINLFNALAAVPKLRAKILSPGQNGVLSDIVPVYGIADGDSFEEYVLEYGEGNSSENWQEILVSASPVTEGLLGEWNTGSLSGNYTIRLRVGETNLSCVRVFVSNAVIAEISSPLPEDTAVGTAIIMGTAACPDFAYYSVEYAPENDPNNWSALNEMFTPVYEDTLCKWNLNSVPQGRYILRLSVYSGGGPEASCVRAVYACRSFNGCDGWRVALDTTPSIIANYSDLNDDGLAEIIVGTASGIRVFDVNGNEVTAGIPEFPVADCRVPAAIGNLDGDGKDDMVFVTKGDPLNPSRLYGFPTGAPSFVSELPVSPDINYDPTLSLDGAAVVFLKDLNHDGLDEINFLSGGYYQTYCIYNPDGSNWASGFPFWESGQLYQCADLDGDALDEIYCCVGLDEIYQIDLERRIVDTYEFDPAQNIRILGLSGVDVDSDGILELIAFAEVDSGSRTNLLYAFKAHFNLVPGWPHDTHVDAYNSLRSPIFGDIDNDGRLDYCSRSVDVSLTGLLHAWHIDGTPFGGVDGVIGNSQEASYLYQPVLSDIDGNGEVDVISLVCKIPLFESSQDAITAWDHTGKVISGWPKIINYFHQEDVPTHAHRNGVPTMADFDNDGFLDMVFPTQNGELFFQRFSTIYDPDKCPAPMWRYGRNLSNVAFSTLIYPVVRNINFGSSPALNVAHSLTPEIFWSYHDSAATTQSQFEIEVGTDEDWAVAELWAPGVIYSSDTSVVYAGQPLTDHSSYYLRIRVSDGSNWSRWYEKSFMLKLKPTLKVPEDYSSIQEAIDSAINGDTVMVNQGIYNETVNFKGKAVYLVSKYGLDAATITSTYNEDAVIFTEGEDSNSIIDGFTITASSSSYGIKCQDSNPTIKNCNIANCLSGIFCYDAAPRIMHNQIHDNDLYGIEFFAYPNGQSNGAEIIGNSVYSNHYAGISAAKVYSAVIARNTACDNGGWGIYLRGNNDIIINNTIAGNENGLGISGAAIDVRNNIIALNMEIGFNPDLSTYDYNDCWNNGSGNITGEHGISVDPLFVDPANAVYALLPNSPCIDAGDPNPQYNDPDGTRSDIGSGAVTVPSLPVAVHINFGPNQQTDTVRTLTPRVYWSYYDTAPTSQMLFELEVGTDQDWEIAEMWNTGMVFSRDTSLLYEGNVLSNLKRYFLRLRVSDGLNWGEWREESFVTRIGPVIRVPEDYSQIQAAIDCAGDGDTVLVSPGLYHENISIVDREISLVALRDSGLVGIEALTNGGAVINIGNCDSGTCIDGFHIDGNMQTIGISCSKSDIVVQNCDIFNCTWTGIRCANSKALISHNNFYENTYGINISTAGAQIYANYFHDNGKAIFLISEADAGVYVTGNTIWNNYNPGNDYPGSVVCLNSDNIFIINNTIALNDVGIGIYGGTSDINIRNNIISSNTGRGLIPAGAVYDYNDTWDNGIEDSPGPHGISADPLFADPANGDFNLLSESPCIDAGDPGEEYNDPDGSRNDIGAHWARMANLCGDINHDTKLDLVDAVYIVNYIFLPDAPAPVPIESADTNCDGTINLVDIIYFVSYLYRNGPAPCDVEGDGVPDC